MDVRHPQHTPPVDRVPSPATLPVAVAPRRMYPLRASSAPSTSRASLPRVFPPADSHVGGAGFSSMSALFVMAIHLAASASLNASHAEAMR